MEYTLRSTLDLTQVKDLKRDEPLRVAAVRDGRVLGSRLIDLAKARALDKLAVDIPFDLPPRESPAGVELRIGPEAPEAILPHYDAHVVRPSREQITALKPGAVIDLGKQRISDAIYLGWWRNCHRYTVTGRLVRQVVRGASVCNEPVPGAVVEAYDVDRFFFWLRKTLITTATTDTDGVFTMTFRWCCWRWWFYPYLGWYIDQPQWDQLRDLLGRFRRLVPNVPIPIDPNPPDPPSLLRLAKTLDTFDPHGAGNISLIPGGVLAPEIARPLEITQAGSLLRPARKLTAEASKVLADIRAFYPWWWWRGTDCFPDLLFRATQAAAGGIVIYDEPFSATRWEVTPSPSPYDAGNLLASDEAISIDVCQDDIPEGDCFKFTDVGTVQVPQIGSVATGGALAGYSFPGTRDEPFGRSLDIKGRFGLVTITNPASFVDYYKIQVAPWGGDPTNLPVDAAFSDVPYARLGRLDRHYWGVVPTPSPHTDWIPCNLGPEPGAGPTQGLYRTVESFQREFEAANGGPPGAWGWIWTDAQLIAKIDTRYLPDGLAVLRLVGYRQVGRHPDVTGHAQLHARDGSTVGGVAAAHARQHRTDRRHDHQDRHQHRPPSVRGLPGAAAEGGRRGHHPFPGARPQESSAELLAQRAPPAGLQRSPAQFLAGRRARVDDGRVELRGLHRGGRSGGTAALERRQLQGRHHRRRATAGLLGLQRLRRRPAALPVQRRL